VSSSPFHLVAGFCCGSGEMEICVCGSEGNRATLYRVPTAAEVDDDDDENREVEVCGENINVLSSTGSKRRRKRSIIPCVCLGR
jgi:hypothetical protein